MSTYVHPGEGQHYPMIDGVHIHKTTVHDANCSFEVFEVVAAAAPMAPPHISPWTGVLFLLQGRVTARVGQTTYDVETGGLVVFPAGTPSTFEVVGDSARFLAITSGVGAGKFFADFATSVPADQPAHESMAKILSVSKRHGVTLAGM